MCGIAGYYHKTSIDKDSISNILKVLKDNLIHRGPDSFGYHIEENRGFLNTRLAIVDTCHGDQPIYTQGMKQGIVFNGEIYNYQELKQELGSSYKFVTDTDTEVVLHMYQKYGVDCFSKLEGMFAVCIWNEDEFILVRDSVGIKPLYVYEDDKCIIFSSEVSAILQVPGICKDLNIAGIADYLCFRYICRPYTLFKCIRKVNPGEIIRINTSNYQMTTSFFTVNNKNIIPKGTSLPHIVDIVEYTLKESTKSQLIGEAPIGLCLSGGLDSSLLAMLLQSFGCSLESFNIGFPELNEFSFSRLVAQTADLRYEEYTVTNQDMIKTVSNVVRILDEPIADPAQIPLYMLAQEMKRKVKVVLSGEGADELFAGYPQYLSCLNTTFPDSMKYSYFLRSSLYNLDFYNLLVDKSVRIIPFIRFKSLFTSQDSLLESMLYHDRMTWLPDNLMMKADKILMQHSLEGRFPYLSTHLINLSCEVPQQLKMDTSGSYGKLILRLIGEKYLPRSILTRSKMGFSVPIPLLLSSVKTELLDTISSSSITTSLFSILDKNQISKLFSEYYHEKKNTTSDLYLWTIAVLVLWCFHKVRR